MRRSTLSITLLALFWALPLAAQETANSVLPDSQPLALEGDIASLLVAGVDRFLLFQIEQSVDLRASFWKRDFSSAANYAASVAPNRKHLAKILGVRDKRVAFEELELVATTGQAAVVGQGAGYQVLAVRWPVLRDIHGEGLLLVPAGRHAVADVIALPDCGQTPEMLAGLTAELPSECQTARRLAESGCRVLVPLLINRDLQTRGRRATLTNREFLYRSGFELGRHLIGYELQKILAIVDWFEKRPNNESSRIGVFGWGEGGLLALYAAGLDPRIDAACVSGYFTSRQNVWQEPIDRNVFGLLEQFGDAELATLVAPRPLIVETAAGPELVLTSGKGGAPARLVSPELKDVNVECERAAKLVAGMLPPWRPLVVTPPAGHFGSPETLGQLLAALSPGAEPAPPADPPRHLRHVFDPAVRQARQIHELDDHNQWLLRESSYVRAEFLKQLDSSSLESYEQSVEPYRDYFRKQVVGQFDQRLADPRPRTRRAYDEPGWTGYEVVLDVFPDVFAYGILCVPRDISPGERRPVVVCQHGLEGRPQDIVTGGHRAYHDFAGKLAERGFITFAPQNLYIFGDRFRTLQRKANPLKKTLFSIIVPQHQQIVNWLRTLPVVDADRIAFYGLSYGGKSAMRIPPLVTDYCLSICSADFNEWVWKNASTRSEYSYIGTGEYEIFEWDLGSTFNYAEMAALIAPRPFMVERGHFDGVASDEAVAYEFAKVRHLYNARLGIGDRAEIEWFVGPHTIHGQGTFRFLHRHLDWPEPPK